MLLALSCADAASRGTEVADALEPSTAFVCPTCKPWVGGETTDFGGGTPHPCSAFYEPRDAAPGDSGPFDLAGIERLIDREFEAPLVWRSPPVVPGVAVTGYGSASRVRGRARAGTHTLFQLDTSSCDGGTCRNSDGTLEVGQDSCAGYLTTRFTVELETTGGSLIARADGTAFSFRPTEYPRATADQDLSTAPGTLELTLTDAEFDRGLLQIELAFAPDAIRGWLRLQVLAPGSDRFGATTVLEAAWPELPIDTDAGFALPD